jgi:hypothetical protein
LPFAIGTAEKRILGARGKLLFLKQGCLSAAVNSQPMRYAANVARWPLTEEMTIRARRGTGTYYLLDHLVGTSEKHWRHREAERLGRLEVDEELETLAVPKTMTRMRTPAVCRICLYCAN